VDDTDYRKHLNALSVTQRACLRAANESTARAVIFTDPDNQQFTGFYPGFVPTAEAWLTHLRSLDFSDTEVVIQAPYPEALMRTTLSFFCASPNGTGTPLRIFVPGQYADQLTAPAMATLLQMADWVVGNAHEIDTIRAHQTGGAPRLMLRTDGAQPITVFYPDGQQRHITVPKVAEPVDPTGCGDAFVAGLVAHLVAQPRPCPIRQAADPLQPTRLQAAIEHGIAQAQRCLARVGSQAHRLD